MIRNLLCFLFVFALAFPAVAMSVSDQNLADCHGMKTAAMPSPGHGESHAPDEGTGNAMAQHGCIGCIAPYRHDLLVPEAPAIGSSALAEWIAATPPSTRDGPETPPPRRF